MNQWEHLCLGIDTDLHEHLLDDRLVASLSAFTWHGREQCSVAVDEARLQIGSRADWDLWVRQCRHPASVRVADRVYCYRHGEQQLEWLRAHLVLPLIAAVGRASEREAHREALAVAARRASTSVVYYVQRGDGMIKIGYSGNLKSRLSSLQREHGRLEVLATHRGARDAEVWQHRAFAHLRIHPQREWFRPGDDLLEFIDKVNARRFPQSVALAAVA